MIWFINDLAHWIYRIKRSGDGDQRKEISFEKVIIVDLMRIHFFEQDKTIRIKLKKEG